MSLPPSSPSPSAAAPSPAVLCTQSVKSAALAAGFAACGLAPAGPLSAERAEQRATMLRRGYHAGMDYLERHEDLRLDPRLLLPGAQTVVSLAWPYPPRPEGGAPIAAYALGADYHLTVKAALRSLAQRLGLGDAAAVRCCVDTAPVDERYWAWRAGVGFIGRSGMLIVPRLGSRLFLGEILTTAAADAYDVPLTPDIASHRLCGKCRRCLEACPGGALTPDGLDANRCLSYLTIEHRGPLPAAVGRWMHATPGTPLFYGCDRCAEVCPYNAPASGAAARETGQHGPAAGAGDAALPPPSPARLAENPGGAGFWTHLSVEDYRALFKGSAVKRAKYDGLMRNIAAFYAAAPPAGEPVSAETGEAAGD